MVRGVLERFYSTPEGSIVCHPSQAEIKPEERCLNFKYGFM